MNRPACFRLSALLLIVLLAASPAFAARATLSPRTADFQSLVASLWQGLLDLVSFEKGRGTIDPNGEPAVSADKGRSTIDPNGDPVPTTDSSGSTGATGGSETDGRSTIDPDGQP
jgi:hypothetical protein